MPWLLCLLQTQALVILQAQRLRRKQSLSSVNATAAVLAAFQQTPSVEGKLQQLFNSLHVERQSVFKVQSAKDHCVCLQQDVL